MALEKNILTVPFASGVDTKTNQKLVPNGKLLTLQNGSFKEGATIIKRNGYSSLRKLTTAAGVSIVEGRNLSTFNNELVQIGRTSTGGPLKLLSFSDGLELWSDRGDVTPVGVRNEVVARDSYNKTNADCDTGGGVTVYAWEDGRGGTRCSVFDEQTGSPLLSDAVVTATGLRPKVVNVGRYTWVVYADGANLRGKQIDTSSPGTIGAEFTFSADLHASGRFDALRYNRQGFTTDFVFAYATTAPSVGVGFVLETGAVGSGLNGRPALITTGGLADKSISITTTSDAEPFVLVVYSNTTTGLRLFERNADLTLSVADAGISASTAVSNNTVGWTTNNDAVIFTEETAAATYNSRVETRTYTQGGVVGAPVVIRRSVGLATKAFVYGSEVYVVSVHDSTLQATYFLLTSGGTIRAKMLYGLAGGLKVGHLAGVPLFTSDEYAFASLQKTRFFTENGKTFSLAGVSRESILFDVDSVESVQMGQNLLLTGGTVGAYDGPSVVENGFHLFPENIVATPFGAGGSMASGTYGTAFLWAWPDARGQIHRSAASVPQSVVVTGPTGRIDFTVPTLRLTEKRPPIRADAVLECYTTVANGLVYFKTPNGAAANPNTTPVYNTTTADTVAFSRTQADAAITSNEIIYTQGGVLANIGAPAARFITTRVDRVWLAGLEDAMTVLPSKVFVQGEGVGFAEELAIKIDPLGGNITGIAAMDDKTIIFKESAIFYIGGEGPDDAGLTGAFTEPILVTTDVGCVSFESISNIPDGLVFQTAKGIYLLTRGLQSIYIGADVEGFNANEISSSALVDSQNQVRFTSLTSDALVFDYYFKQWSTWKNHVAADATTWRGNYVYLRTDGTVYQESATTFLDNGTDIHMTLETAWLHLENYDGFQRIYRAEFSGDFKTEHKLRVRVAYDYQPFFIHEHIFDPALALVSSTFGDDSPFGEIVGKPFGGVGTDLVYEFEVHLPRQKCSAIKFHIEDVGSNPGQAYSLSNVVLHIGVKNSPKRYPAAKKIP